MNGNESSRKIAPEKKGNRASMKLTNETECQGPAKDEQNQNQLTILDPGVDGGADMVFPLNWRPGSRWRRGWCYWRS